MHALYERVKYNIIGTFIIYEHEQYARDIHIPAAQKLTIAAFIYFCFFPFCGELGNLPSRNHSSKKQR